ncbi:hypothetical protein, partial [Pseudomonas aeruginosa]
SHFSLLIPNQDARVDKRKPDQSADGSVGAVTAFIEQRQLFQPVDHPNRQADRDRAHYGVLTAIRTSIVSID